MINGVSNLNVDSKGRLAIPAKHREFLLPKYGNQLVITLDSSDHLLLYPKAIWQEVETRLLALPIAQPVLKKYQRLVLGHAEFLELDTAGRILIPSHLRSLVKLDKEIVLVGIGNRFELWNAQTWLTQTQAALALDKDELALHLGGFTL